MKIGHHLYELTEKEKACVIGVLDTVDVGSSFITSVYV